MASLAEVARLQSSLDRDGVSHLQRLVAGWGLLADLCFADLMLFVPGRRRDTWVVCAQVRPTTSQTLYREDWVGREFTDLERPLVARTWQLAEEVEGEINHPDRPLRVRVHCVPVWDGARLVGVLTRESAPDLGRQPGELERTYVGVFGRFARMISEGAYPYPVDAGEMEEAPRVGDGVIVLAADRRVEFVSPNAVSALHRLGIHNDPTGMRLGDLGFDESAIRSAYASCRPTVEELDRGLDVTVTVRCLPLLAGGVVDGALVLLRDISELRLRDRMLVSKDATIREIHHRVKNNLQTISSLLRLQARRLEHPEARAAVEESVRRIRSIALVHEILSRDPGEEVPFVEIVRPLVRMVEDGLVAGRPVTMGVEGDPGRLPSTVATPLAVVVTELIQNAVEHAFGPDGAGEVVVQLAATEGGVEVQVRDNGSGPPPDFDLDAGANLGLTIVRTLVTTELGGTISVSRNAEGGTTVRIRVPVGRSPERAS